MTSDIDGAFLASDGVDRAPLSKLTSLSGLSGLKAVVTGGASGIGLATARSWPGTAPRWPYST